MRKMIPAYLTVRSCALLAVNSYAVNDNIPHEGKEGPHHVMHFDPMHKMTERLGLSQDQQQKFNALQEKDKAAYQTQYEALRENNAQMHQLITSGAYTDEKAAQLADKQGKIVTELAKLRASEMAGLYALL